MLVQLRQLSLDATRYRLLDLSSDQLQQAVLQYLSRLQQPLSGPKMHQAALFVQTISRLARIFAYYLVIISFTQHA